MPPRDVGDPVAARRTAWIALGVIALGAVAIRMAMAVALPNTVWPDENFQSLEQAHRLVFGQGVVPWEFRDGTRSWLLPGALAAAMSLGRIGGGLWSLRAAQLLLVLVSLAPIAVAFAAALRARGLAEGVVAGGAAALWYELILFAPKGLSEVVAAHLLLLGLYLEATARTGRRRLLAGALVGAAIALRIHLAPAVLLALALTCRADLRRWRTVLAGLGASVVVAGLVDLATWGRPFQSVVAAIRVNVVQGKAAQYGTAPWSGYLEAIWATWSWATLVVVPLAVLGARRYPALAACALGVLATHTVFAHKELRFVYPAIALAIVLAAIGAAEAVSWARARLRVHPAGLAAAALVVWGAVSLARAASYETTGIDPVDETPFSRWSHAAWGLESMQLAGTKPDLCGVGLFVQNWEWTGGYTYLHRDVPIFLIETRQDGVDTAGGYNAVIAPAEFMRNLRGFEVRRCWPAGHLQDYVHGDICYGERPGGCAPVRGQQINDRLRSIGA